MDAPFIASCICIVTPSFLLRPLKRKEDRTLILFSFFININISPQHRLHCYLFRSCADLQCRLVCVYNRAVFALCYRINFHSNSHKSFYTVFIYNQYIVFLEYMYSDNSVLFQSRFHFL